MYTSELRDRLNLLEEERRQAEAAGLANCEAYMNDLQDEISECRAAFAGAAVTEIAIARAEVDGRLWG
jgi:hypothetical protein